MTPFLSKLKQFWQLLSTLDLIAMVFAVSGAVLERDLRF